MSAHSLTPHFWQGQWINDQELETRIQTLPEQVLAQAADRVSLSSLLTACDRLSEDIRHKAGAYLSLHACLTESGATTAADASGALAEIAGFLKKDVLELKLKRELGSTTPFSVTRAQYEDAIFEAWAPLGFLVHISPQNAFSVGPMSVLEGLLSGNFNFLKTGGSESLFPQLFLAALCQRDESQNLARFVIAARISSRNKALLERVFEQADGIAAWGGEESVQSIRKMARPGTKIIEWGHKISLAYLTSDQWSKKEVLDQLATECCVMEQQACSSPQCVYLDTDDWQVVKAFSNNLAESLKAVSPKFPRAIPGDAESAEISMVTSCHKLETSISNAECIESADGSWRIYADERPALSASPLYRSIWVRPLPRRRIVEVLRPMRHYLQTVGLACSISEAPELARLLVSAGALRMRRLGEMTGSYSGEAHDGVYALQKYTRRISYQLSKQAQGISRFDELANLNEAPWSGLPNLVAPDITPKEKFQSAPNDLQNAKLYFKSGGSTGAPKLSAFSHEQYIDHITVGAEGVYAAGLDPLKDRTMNLFFGGGLYGGFISFFSALEALKVVQFPMTAHGDFEMVAQTIVDQRVNVLCGMPSYLLQLFENQWERLKSYRGVEKIFFAGEHFSDAQLKYLRDEFGVQLIRSGVYGSVDIGPMGFQCTECQPGEHHLQQKIQFLEILKMDSDEPVQGEEVGRLVFSPARNQQGANRPSRYEIGDVGHWIQDPAGICACGRASPRFKLLGRMGDIFRIGSMFLNYQKFFKTLSEHAAYSGELQARLSYEGNKEKLSLLVTSPDASRSPQFLDEFRALCLKHYDDLNEVVTNDRTLLFEILNISTSEFKRARGSGKLVRVVDERTRS